MTENDFYNLGAAPVKRKKIIFMAIGLGLLGFAILMMLIFVLALTVGDEETKKQSGGLIAGMIVFGIVFGVPAIVMLCLMAKQNKLLANRTNLIEDGKRINDIRETKKAEKEAKAAEIAAIEEAKLEMKKPDMEIDKEFFGAKSFVWINTDSKLIQFSVPSGEFVKDTSKSKFFAWLFNSKEELLRKTKILNLSDLDDIKLIHDYEKVTTTDLNGVGLKGEYIASGNGRINQTTTTYHYYQVDFMFRDIDEPVIHIFFNNDSEQAERLYQTIKILTGK